MADDDEDGDDGNDEPLTRGGGAKSGGQNPGYGFLGLGKPLTHWEAKSGGKMPATDLELGKPLNRLNGKEDPQTQALFRECRNV